MTKRRPRSLSADEEALWERIAKQTDPLNPKRKATPAKTPSTPKAQPKPDPKRNGTPVPPFRLGEKRTDTTPRHDFAPSIGESLSSAPIHMDRKKHTRMTRGKLKPEGKIDLHGMTLAQAHPALTRFLFDSHARDRRQGLVITGKGRDRDEDGPIPQRRGVLKHQVPHWLQSAPLNTVVLQVSEAHLKHGGTGAYYVYLRRRR